MDDRVLALANAVLYEGYSLYPYRRSALKNTQRWHFGVLYPRAFCARTQANDAWAMQTECLVTGTCPEIAFGVTVRFLQLLCDGAIAREICTGELKLPDLLGHSHIRCFEFAGVRGEIQVSAAALRGNLWRLTVRIVNSADFGEASRDEALMVSLVSTHAVLGVTGGAFVSAIDPPELLREAAAECRNIGCWPVLVGADGALDTMLAAPIILSDHPKISAQSAGDHFDCTEIDEMLALHILTLTDAEKTQMREDGRTREMLERTEALPASRLSNLHGIMTPGNAAAAWPAKGQRVVLRPKRRADIFDMVLDGKVAIVETVEQDFEDRFYVTVTVEDDPGRDLGAAGKPGHRFFFGFDEIEWIKPE